MPLSKHNTNWFSSSQILIRTNTLESKRACRLPQQTGLKTCGSNSGHQREASAQSLFHPSTLRFPLNEVIAYFQFSMLQGRRKRKVRKEKPYHLARFALLRIPACSKSNNTNARLTAFALSLTLDPMFGIHSHKTSGNAQLLHLLRRTWKPSFFHSTSIPVNFSSHFIYQKLYLCVCVCVCVCVNASVCVYINVSICVLVCAIHLLIR